MLSSDVVELYFVHPHTGVTLVLIPIIDTRIAVDCVHHGQLQLFGLL